MIDLGLQAAFDDHIVVVVVVVALSCNDCGGWYADSGPKGWAHSTSDKRVAIPTRAPSLSKTDSRALQLSWAHFARQRNERVEDWLQCSAAHVDHAIHCQLQAGMQSTAIFRSLFARLMFNKDPPVEKPVVCTRPSVQVCTQDLKQCALHLIERQDRHATNSWLSLEVLAVEKPETQLHNQLRLCGTEHLQPKAQNRQHHHG